MYLLRNYLRLPIILNFSKLHVSIQEILKDAITSAASSPFHTLTTLCKKLTPDIPSVSISKHHKTLPPHVNYFNPGKKLLATHTLNTLLHLTFLCQVIPPNSF